MKEHFDFVILGAGIAGLTAARELADSGKRVLLIEKSAETGGLARTLDHNGYRFDIGGHRFHSNNPHVLRWLGKLLGDDLLTVPRRSHILLNNRYIPYPLKFPDVLQTFPPRAAAQMLASYLLANLARPFRPDHSFEDWVINRFGKHIYQIFFQPYTEKVWGISGKRLSADWASQRIGLPSLTSFLRHTLIPDATPPATAISHFFYPRHGFGMIPEALTQTFLLAGGVLATESSAVRIKPTPVGYDIMLQPSAVTVSAENLIATIPLHALLAVLPNGDTLQPRLDYRGLLCVYLAYQQERVSRDSWTYFPDKNLIFGRIHEPKNWSAAMIPDPSTTSLCVEIFASPHEPLWSADDQDIVSQVVQQLHQLGMVKRNKLIGAGLRRVPHAYPIYRIGYQQQLATTHHYLSQFKNLHLLGRTGTFFYMNSDGVIEQVLDYLAQQGWTDSAEITLPNPQGRWV